MHLKYILYVFLLFGIKLLPAQEWIQQSIDLAINARFTEAESLLILQQRKEGPSVKVSFYYASVLNSKMTHFENRNQEKAFHSAINKVIEIGEKSLGVDTINSKEKSRVLFYMGSAYGYLAFYQGKTGDWFSALRNGHLARDYLLQSIKEDSTQWDAYLGLGAYKYWLAARVYWLPFVDDDRELGIEMIKKTIEHNGYSKPMAMHQLIYVLLDYGDFETARQLAEQLVKKYPDSPFMYWAHSHVYMKMKNLPKAIASYKKLLHLIEKDPQANPNHKITCLARLMDMYARSGSCKNVNQLIREIEKDEYYAPLRNNDEVERLLEEVRERCSK